MGILNRLQTYFTWLTTDPIGFIIYIIYFATCIVTALVLHEVAHGYMALHCGDPTAKMMGRLSLNPKKHLDPLGTIALIFLGFGWAKPVPVNPRNFSNYRRDDFLVSIAGIVVNLTLFLLTTALAVGLNGLLWKPEVIARYGASAFLRSDGIGYSAIVFGADNTHLMLHPWLMYIQRFLLMFGTINLSLAIFNFLPIPPLDGYHIFNDLLFKGRFQLSSNGFQIMQIVLMFLIFSGMLTGVLGNIMGSVERGILNVFLHIAGQA